MMAINGEIESEHFSDPEDFIDEADDYELVGELINQEPQKSQYEECCIIVFNIPVVGSDRLPKLKNVLSGVFSINNTYKYKDHYPLDSDAKTKGYCFLEYQSKDAAISSLQVCDGYKLDKNHTFSAYPFTTLREIKEPEKNWKQPERRQYVDVGDLWWWLQNPKCLDQFAIQFELPNDGLRLEVYYQNRNNEPIPVEDAHRDNWSDDIFKWSPFGSYLVTFHDKNNQRLGVVLWAGEKFIKLQKFAHEGVNFIEFSPNEKYIVTYSCNSNSFNQRDSENCLRVYEVVTGELKKAFSPSGKSPTKDLPEWPFIKWSYDEKYLAFCRQRSNCINLFNSDDFLLCDNKAIDVEGLVTFEFNPAKNIIAYYSEEKSNANTPAEIGILEIHSNKREKIRAQRIYSVSQANLYWQKAGYFLAAHTERYQKMVKTKDGEIRYSGTSSHLEIFDCTEKTISVQTIQLAEPFINFAWDPKGSKFCVLIGAGMKVTPFIYRHDKGRPAPQLMGKIESGSNLNTITWAPQGGLLAVYGANTQNGLVYFIDATGAEATRIRALEHTSLSQAYWDPTGRYFATCTFGGMKARSEMGYRIHSFQGREIIRRNIESLLRFKWRSRPPAPLNEQKMKEIKKSLKELSKKFEEEDRRELLKVSKEIIEFRLKALSHFTNLRDIARRVYTEEQNERLKLRGGLEQLDTNKDLVEETITVALSTELDEMKEDE